MATFQTRTRAKGTTHTATIRMKGFATVSETFSRKTDARAWAATTEATMKARKFKDPRLAEIPFGETLDLYLVKVSSKKAASTHEREIKTARALKAGLGEKTLLSDIVPFVVARYRDTRLETVGASSVRKELALLSHMCQIVKREWGIPIQNPVEEIQRPAPPQGRLVFLSEEEAYLLATECKKSRNRRLHAYVLTLLQTALRPGSAAGLTCGQLNLTDQYIDLGTTKNGDPIRVAITDTLLIELKKLTDGKHAADYIFLRLHGREPTETQIAHYFRSAFEHARKRAGLDHVHLHDLRHTAASHLLMAGVDLRTLAEILGHRTLQMVMRYTHLFYKHKRAAVDKIEHLGLRQQA